MKVTSKSSSQWYDVDPVTCVSAAGATEANPTPNASGGSYGPDRRIAHPQTSHLCSGAIFEPALQWNASAKRGKPLTCPLLRQKFGL